MFHQVQRVIGIAFLLLLVAGRSYGQLKNGFHEDAGNGYKIKVPQKWDAVPIGIDEKWIVAKFLSPKETVAHKSEFPITHKPFMRVIAFSDEARKQKGLDVKAEEGSLHVSLKNPYKDYQDYLKRNQSEGYYVFKEKEEKIAGIPCKEYEIKIEKNAMAPKRVIAWVFHRDDADYAVEFEVLEEHYDKLSPEYYTSLKSFRFFDKVAAAASGGVTGKPAEGTESGIKLWEDQRAEWKKLSPAERKQKRIAIENSRADRTLKALPAGWTSKNTPHFLVVTHTDEKSTQRVVEAAEAFRTWLEKTFNDLSDEYVMKGIIRVCASSEEYNLFHSGSGESDYSNAREIVVFKDAVMGRRAENELLYRNMFNAYLYDKDSLVSRYVPAWIEMAFSIMSARPNAAQASSNSCPTRARSNPSARSSERMASRRPSV